MTLRLKRVEDGRYEDARLDAAVWRDDGGRWHARFRGETFDTNQKQKAKAWIEDQIEPEGGAPKDTRPWKIGEVVTGHCNDLRGENAFHELCPGVIRNGAKAEFKAVACPCSHHGEWTDERVEEALA